MYIVHVHVHVKPDQVEAFRAASVENARESVREPGVARFDVIQQQEDPTRFGPRSPQCDPEIRVEGYEASLLPDVFRDLESG